MMTKLFGLTMLFGMVLPTSLFVEAVKGPTNWAVAGYEKFKDPPANRRRAPWIAKDEQLLTGKDQTDRKEPSAISKAMLGIGAACAVAAIGGNILADQPRERERALVEATRKPVVLIKQEEPATEGASISNEVFNLCKSIVGVGVLSLPAGVAAFGSAPSAFIPAAGLITLIGILSAFGFSIIGRVCSYTGAQTYREAWSRSVGEGSSWIPAWSATCKTFLFSLAFSMVLGDTFSGLFDTNRNSTLLAITVLILMPLCLMKDLKSLAPCSAIGVLGMVFTAISMAVRYLDGTYAFAGDSVGSLISEVSGHLRPRFGEMGMKSVLSPNALILVCMLSTSFMAHFNAPKMYAELKDKSMKRFNKVVSVGFGLSMLLMGLITMLGYFTFGKACDGLVLNNYAANDAWMGFSRIAVAISLLFSYPLVFQGCRDGFLDLAQIPTEQRQNGLSNLVTISLLGMITVLACSLEDVSFVLAFGGATLGNALTYIYPAIMYQAVLRRQGRKERVALHVAMISALFGLIVGAIGAAMALKSLE